MPPILSKDDALARMRKALDLIGTEQGEDAPTETALTACKTTITMIMLSLEMSGKDKSHDAAKY